MEFALDGPVRFIKIENIGEGELIETPKYTIDFDAHKQLARSQLRSDDIVFAIAGATTGKCAIVRPEHLPANTNQAVAYIRPNSYVRPMFLVAWLQNPRLLEAMWEITSKSAQPNLSMENLGNLPIPIPPKVEQDKIVEYIHKIGGGYLTLIVEAERAIELLLERRIALISAAVTGKIDVRGYAPKEAVA
jgi:type I restriction enzyme S subunit